MSDPAPDPGQDKESLLYDYSKHLLSLALLGIGGIVTLGQSPQGRLIAAPQLAMLVVCFALAGFAALTCTAAILRARRLDLPLPTSCWIASQAAMMFLGLGVGAFLTFWLKALL